MVVHATRQTVNDKIFIYNMKEYQLKTLYFNRNEVRKYIINDLNLKSDKFKTDQWFSFENKAKTFLYFQKYDNLIG